MFVKLHLFYFYFGLHLVFSQVSGQIRTNNLAAPDQPKRAFVTQYHFLTLPIYGAHGKFLIFNMYGCLIVSKSLTRFTITKAFTKLLYKILLLN